MPQPNIIPERIAEIKQRREAFVYASQAQDFAEYAHSVIPDLISEIERLTAGLGKLEKRWRDKAELIAMPGTRARMLVMCNELAALMRGNDGN